MAISTVQFVSGRGRATSADQTRCAQVTSGNSQRSTVSELMGTDHVAERLVKHRLEK